MDSKVIIPSPVFGKHAQLVADALSSVDIAANVLASVEDLLFELALKNVYILTTNISGLETGGTVGEFWSKHQDVATEVANEIVLLQQKLTGQSLHKEPLIEAMVDALTVISNTAAWAAAPPPGWNAHSCWRMSMVWKCPD